jgi:hypothetical protein
VVYATGKPRAELSPYAVHVAIDSTATDNRFKIYSGTAGLGVDGEAVFLGTVDVNSPEANDANLTIDNCTSAATTLVQQGGTVNTRLSQYTAYTMYGGTANLLRANITTLTVNSGRAVVIGDTLAQTISALFVGKGGIADLSRARVGVTVSACDLYSGGSLLDPTGRGTYSTGIDLNHCGVEDVTVKVGHHRRLTLGAAN